MWLRVTEFPNPTQTQRLRGCESSQANGLRSVTATKNDKKEDENEIDLRQECRVRENGEKKEKGQQEWPGLPHHTPTHNPSRASGRMLAPWEREKLTCHWRDGPALLQYRGARPWAMARASLLRRSQEYSKLFLARQHLASGSSARGRISNQSGPIWGAQRNCRTEYCQSRRWWRITPAQAWQAIGFTHHV